MADTGYAAHEHLVAPARPRPELWRLILGCVVIVAVVVAMNTVLMTVLQGLGPAGWVDGFLHGQSSAGMFVILGAFGFVTFGVAVVARALQGRGLLSVIGSPALAVRQFWQVLRALLVFGGVILVLPPYDMGSPLIENLSFGVWIVLLPLSLAGLLIQTSAEEILFRGYLQQSLAARFSSPQVWMVVPSILFALGHYLPEEAGENALLITVWAGVFGLVTADLTARAGTLGPAIAVHLFNNMIAMLFVAFPDGMSGLSLYLIPFEMTDVDNVQGWLAVDFAVMIVVWLIARLVLRR